MTELEPTIDALLSEHRVFEPSADFRNRALWNDPGIYEEAAADPEAFWAQQADSLRWMERWHQVMEWNPPWVTWFKGGMLNVSDNWPRVQADVAAALPIAGRDVMYFDQGGVLYAKRYGASGERAATQDVLFGFEPRDFFSALLFALVSEFNQVVEQLLLRAREFHDGLV